MRGLSLALALAACGPPRGDCEVDNDCGGDYVCARNGECLPADSVHPLRITWTVRGQIASEANCAPAPTLYLIFYGYDINDQFGFEPVPCEAGLFTIDKLPSRFTSVELGERGGFVMEKPITGTGMVTFDLAP